MSSVSTGATETTTDVIVSGLIGCSSDNLLKGGGALSICDAVSDSLILNLRDLSFNAIDNIPATTLPFRQD
jgi:hypothetical protein